MIRILVASLATNFQDLVAKVKNLVALAPVLGAILRPAIDSHSQKEHNEIHKIPKFGVNQASFQ